MGRVAHWDSEQWSNATPQRRRFGDGDGLAKELHPETWLGLAMGERIAELTRRSEQLRVDMVQLGVELQETLATATRVRDDLIRRLFGHGHKSPHQDEAADRLSRMTIGPLVEVWKALVEDAVTSGRAAEAAVAAPTELS